MRGGSERGGKDGIRRRRRIRSTRSIRTDRDQDRGTRRRREGILLIRGVRRSAEILSLSGIRISIKVGDMCGINQVISLIFE